MIAILDYGLGNIKAFENIYKRARIPCISAKEPQELVGANRLILPGVGSFDQAMEMLESSGLKKPMLEMVIDQKVPILGICIGMHIMGEGSEEGKKSGLGLIPGKVLLIPDKTIPVPHMGWNKVKFNNNVKNSFIDCIPNLSEFYFLHSYYFSPSDSRSTCAVVEYPKEIPCIVKRDNIFGIQFHPEKSHEQGENLLLSFAKEWSC